MSRRVRYNYYDPPRHPSVTPGHLRRLLWSECELGLSLACLVRWRVELYGMRVGWLVMWDGEPLSVSHEEVREEEEQCDAVHAARSVALARVRHTLTVGARPRWG
jgi:hypothetical protein